MAAAPATPGAARARSHTDIVAITLLLVAAGHLLPGILAVVSPNGFYESIASYPPENGHFIRDLGSWQIATGLLALVAWRRPSFRAPVLGILAVQFALHTLSHVIDVDATEPAWQGPAALVAQAIGVVVLTALFVKESRS